MVILDPYDMTFDAVGVFGLDFYLNLPHRTVEYYLPRHKTFLQLSFSLSRIYRDSYKTNQAFLWDLIKKVIQNIF